MFKRTSRILGIQFITGMLFCSVAFSQQPADAAQVHPVTGLVADHATLSVEDIPLEAEWYENVLGFKVLAKIDADPHMSSWRLVMPGFRIDLIKYKGSTRPAPVDLVYLRQGWIHVVFRVQNLSKALAELQALHVQPEIQKDSNGNPIQIILHDPEGNEVRIRPGVAA